MDTHDTTPRAADQATSRAPTEPMGWPSPTIILEHVAITYRLSAAQLQSKRRDLLTVEAKRVAIHLLAASGRGPTAIAREMHMDHSTAIHHLRHVPLDRWQQQCIADLQAELCHMTARVHDAREPSRGAGGSAPQPAGARSTPSRLWAGVPRDHLQVISMPG